jgi:hypothetical protein
MEYVAQVVPLCVSRLDSLRSRAIPHIQPRAVVCVILCVLGIGLFAYCRQSDRRRRRARNASVQLASQLIASAVQWIETSKQDQNALLQWKHAQMAQVYLTAARSVVTDSQLEQIAGVRISSLATSVRDAMDASSHTLVQRCSKLKKELRAVGTVATEAAQ